MTLPLLAYKPSSQNQRVAGYEVPGDEQPRIYSTETIASGTEMDQLIWAAYRQVYNEQQLITTNRQTVLESQLRAGAISVREFMKGLALSEPFRTRNYDCNNNYRFVQMCVQRFLGRDVYGDSEKWAWSTVLGTKGLQGFIESLLGSAEYAENFGNDTVPYQRRRILPQRAQGEMPFARMPRYGADHRAQLEQLGYFQNQGAWGRNVWGWKLPVVTPAMGQAWVSFAVLSMTLVGAGTIAVALDAWGLISL
jgi:phycobilisome rod-core linker protein